MLQTHHDGHGLNERIVIEPGPGGPGGASHAYTFYQQQGNGLRVIVGQLQFQEGPPGAVGSTSGLTANAVLAALADHLGAFQRGEHACREGALSVTKIEEAMHWQRHRADDRARRGVLGTYEK